MVPLRAGTVRVLGRSPAQARSEVGYVPQASTLDRDFPVSVGEVVAMGRYRRIGWMRRPGPADRRLVTRALARVGLAERAGDRFGALSGGQRQRVLLARAVAQQARLFLLDEPFNGVDATSRELVIEALSSLREAGASVLASLGLVVVLGRRGSVGDDTALAVLLVAFLAVGVAVVSRSPSYAADLDTLLFGRLLTVDDADVLRNGLAAAGSLALVAALHKELVLRAFDPEGAAALGYRLAALDLALDAPMFVKRQE